MQAWLRDLSDSDAWRLWVSGNFPYLAYNTFHPNRPEVEEELDSSLVGLLEVVHYDRLLIPIRGMRELLHSVNLPVNATNLFRAYVEAEKIYYSYQAERGVTEARRYWTMLKDSVIARTVATYT